MSDHTIVEMGFIPPLVRQNAFTPSEWFHILRDIVCPLPADAVIYDSDDDSDTESDAGWYPPCDDVELGTA